MDTKVKDVLSASIVLVGVELLNSPEAVAGFKKTVNSEVSIQEGGAIIGQQMGAPLATMRVLMLAKDRIQIESSSIRTMCRLDYPTKEVLSRLAEVADLAIANTSIADAQSSSFGFNVELVYEQFSEISALQYIARRIFSPAIHDKHGWNLIGGAGRFSFEKNDKRWNVKIEPRFNEESATNVFLSVNLHFSENRFPDKDEILQSLKEAWEQAHDLVKRIDENVID